MTLPLPAGPFACILADPPWSFLTWGGKTGTPHRTANDHYKTMTLAELKELPVARIAAPDSILHLWTVDSHIDVAIDLATEWGFKLKSRGLTWVKVDKDGNPRMSMGYWFRKQSEISLLFTRGKPKRIGKGIREIIFAPRREHSRKPDEQYERIEALSEGPRLELFARNSRPGWESWGNDTERFSIAVDDSDW